MRTVRASGSRPFVGRVRERALLRHLLREAGAGRPAVVVVTGVPGAGKTALLHWMGDEAAAAGAFVLRASGSEGTLPFDALRRLVAPLPELAGVLDGTAESGHEGAGRMAAEVADALAARARRRLLAVLVDDVHDLERSTATVLGAVLTTLDDSGSRNHLRLLVVLGSREPLAEGSLAARAVRLDAARTISVGGFDAHDVHELLRLSGRRPQATLVQELLDDTGGLPLLVESAIEWRAGSPGDGGRFGQGVRVRTIADALRVRFREIDQTGLDVLRLAALLGEPWDPADVVLAGTHGPATMRAVVAAAEAAQVVRAERHGLRFTHPLVRTELLNGLSEDERRALHGTIAERLAAHRRDDATLDDAVTVRLADHLLRSRPPPVRGEPGEKLPPDVAEVCRRAGEITGRWGAWAASARFQAAAAETAAGGGDTRQAGALYFGAGSAAYLGHDPEWAEELLAHAIGHARRCGDAATALRSAMFLARRRAGARFRLGTRVDLAELEAALAEVDGIDVAEVVEAEAALAEALIVSGESDRALVVVAGARDRAGTVAAPAPRELTAALGRVDFAEGIHRLHRLELSAADSCFQAGTRRSAAAGDTLTALYNRSRHALSALMQGAVGDARALALAIEEEALACGYPGEAGFAAAQVAVGHAVAGSGTELADAAERAHRLWRATDFTYIAALLAPVVAAVNARTRGLEPQTDVPASITDLPLPSAVGVLAAVEAFDTEGTRARLRAARWRHGFRGPVTQNRDAVAVALVEAGDLLDEPALVASAGPALEVMYERGVLVTTGWPTTVPRLGAVVARHAGEPERAARLLDHVLSLCEREDLAAERAKALLELARCEAAGASSADVAALLVEALRAFDELSLHGWVARTDEVAQQLGFSAVVPHGAARERAIYTDDVVGSTESNARLGDAVYLEQLRIHDRLVRGRLRECAGLEIKHTGDGLNAVFLHRADAVRCALAVQGDIDAWHRSEPGLALQIRSGLAYGPVIPSGGDFFGLVQSQAARLSSLAGPGEVLATAEVVTGLAAGTVKTASIGYHGLKGLPAPIEVFRLTAT